MNKRKKVKRQLLSLFLVLVMVLPYTPYGALETLAKTDDEWEQEQKLKDELESYTSNFPYGAFAFYEAQSTITEGNDDAQIHVVRQGGCSKAATVDVKAVDITATFKEDYEVYYLDSDGRKVYLQFDEVVLGENENKGTADVVTKVDNIKTEDTNKDASEDKNETSTKVGGLKDAYSNQTGEDTVDSNWREEYEEYLKQAAVVEAANELINTVEGAKTTLHFAKGEYKKTLYIHVNDDDKAESGEYVKLVIGNVSFGVAGEQLQHNIAISDNEETEKIVFAIEDTDIVVNSDAEYVEVTIKRLSGINYYAGAVYRTVSKTAEAGVAYESVDGASVLFLPGETQKTIQIALTKKGETGTYFNVILDEEYVNAEAGKEKASIWFDEKKIMTEDILKESPEKLLSSDGIQTYGVETVSGVVYDTVLMSNPESLHPYASGVDGWAWVSKSWWSLSGATKVRAVSYMYGRTDCWLWWANGKNGYIAVGGNKKASHEYDDGYSKTYTDVFDVSYAESQDGTVKVYVNTDGLNDKAGYKLTEFKAYYPRYTLVLNSEDAKQTIKGKNYTSTKTSTEFNVQTLVGNASWSSKTVARYDYAYLNPGALTNGVQVEKYKFYVGSTYVGETTSNYIYYSDLNKLREKYESVLRNGGYSITVKPVYKTIAATVTFESENATAMAYSGNKPDGTGFKVGDVLNCTMIDKVTFSVTCPSDQEIKVSSVEHLKGNNKSLIQRFTATTADEKTSFTKTIEVNNENEYLKVYYNTPSLTITYTEEEKNAPNANAGAVTLYDYANVKDMIAAGAVGSQIVLSNTHDKLSLLNNTYLMQVVLGEGFDHYEIETPNGKIPFTTRTIWTYRDSKTGLVKSVYGNSFVFSPYFADEIVSYHFKAVQDDESQVGVKGTVYIEETPLFSANEKAVSSKAVGVIVNIGGYQTITANDGTYSLYASFNKGEYVGAYIAYDQLAMATGVDISANAVRDFHIKVDESDALKVTSSTLLKYTYTNELDIKNNKIYENRETNSVLLEDAKYTLELMAETQKAGISPKYAEFYVYDKNGNLKNDYTQKAEFVNGKASLELNPMNVKLTTGEEMALSVGDTITVKLFDENGNGYFEHQTSIIIGEKLEGMYTFNYKGAWKQDDDNAFIKALGYLSIGYDFALDALSNEGGTYTDEDGNQHQLMYIGFGNKFSSDGDNAGKEVYNTLQNTIKELDDINNGDVSVTRNDSIAFFGDDSWNLNVSVGVILDCVMSTDAEHKGEYKFNDYVMLVNLAAGVSKEWEVPVSSVMLTFGLDFSVGDTAEDKYTGVKWHFYNDSDEEYYIKKNDVIDLLASDDISSKGSIGLQVTITGSVKAVWSEIIGVQGNLQVQLENYVGYDTHNGWSDYGAILLKPTVKIIVLKIPIPVWTNTWRHDWGTGAESEASSMSLAMNKALDEKSMLYTSTDRAESLDYSYTDNRPAWNAGEMATTFMRVAANPKSAKSVTEKVLQSGFMSDSDICVQELSDGRYIAVFLDVVEGRADVDKMGAYYSVYDKNEWSKPVLLEDDGTSDQLPVICEAGSKGYLIVWSDASRKFDEDLNFTDRLNSFDLTGRFYDAASNTFSDIMQITKTTIEDNVGDTNPHISYYEDENGVEHMKIYYTKSEYSVTDEDEGEVVGDILNPYQVIAVRSYDFEKDEWSYDYSKALEEQIKEAVGENGYESYVANWYGQEFLDLAPAVEVKEELDEEGYWVEGKDVTISEADMSEAIVRGGDAIAYNDLSLFAYVLDKGGMKQETIDQNLYLQIYNFEDDEYHHPIQITSENAQISNVQFIRSTIRNGNESYEVTWLYYLEDGDIKRINISRLVSGDNNLIEGTSALGQKYYYINKERTDVLGGYEPAEVIARSTEETTDENDVFTSISSFKIKSDKQGRYNYVVWSQLVAVDDEDTSRHEYQLFVVREDTVTGDMSEPVQVTDKKDQYISGFDYVVTKEGNLDVLAGRELLDANGQPDDSTSELVFTQITPSKKLETGDITENEVFVDEDGNLGLQLGTTLKNDSFDKLNDVTVEVLDSKGNVVYTSNETITYYETTETKTADGGVILDEISYTKELGTFDVKGGERREILLKMPLSKDGSYAGTLRVKTGDTVLWTKEISGKVSAVLKADDFYSEIIKRDKVQLSVAIENDSILDSKEHTVTYGYIDESGNKVSLGTKPLMTLESNEISNLVIDVDVDFDKFTSKYNADGSLVDSMQFYLDVDSKDFTTVYHTLELTATTEEVKLMESLKDLSAQYSLYDEDAKIKLLDELKEGESAYLSLLIGDKAAENTPEYVNTLKVVWNETSNDVVSVSPDGIVKAVGAGTTTLKGYVVPADSVSILYDNGYSETVDNYDVKPEDLIIPIEVTLKVSKAKTDNTDEPTTKPGGTEGETTDKPGGSDVTDTPVTGDKSTTNMWLVVIMLSVAMMMGCHLAKKKGENV